MPFKIPNDLPELYYSASTHTHNPYMCEESKKSEATCFQLNATAIHSPHASRFDKQTHILGRETQGEISRYRPLVAALFFCRLHAHSAQSAHKQEVYERCMWAEWQRLLGCVDGKCVCVCVCLHLRSCVWILKGCWPLEEVICLACLFSCYFHTCSFFSTTFSTPSEAPVVCTLNVCSIIWVFRWVKYCDDQFFWPVWGQRVALFLPPFVLPVHIPDNLTQPLLRETLVLLPPADLPLISISSISVTVNSPSLKHTQWEMCWQANWGGKVTANR